ncbi:hypothetical protein NFI96_029253, partial [Prochilodus magdalenae]
MSLTRARYVLLLGDHLQSFMDFMYPDNNRIFQQTHWSTGSVQPLGPKEIVLSNIMTALLEMDLEETGEPAPLENPLDDPESCYEYKTRFVSELMEMVLEDLGPSSVQPPSLNETSIYDTDPENTVGHSEEEPLDGLVSSSDLRDQLVRELLDIQREFNPAESVQPLGENLMKTMMAVADKAEEEAINKPLNIPLEESRGQVAEEPLDDPESCYEYKIRTSELLEMVLEDLGPSSVQPPSLNEPSTDDIDPVNTEGNTVEEPLDGLVSSTEIRDQPIRELLDIQQEEDPEKKKIINYKKEHDPPTSGDREIVSHSLRYISTTITPGTHVPQYTVVGLVDGEPFIYYDSNMKKMVPKTEWMKKNMGEDFWNTESEICVDDQQWNLSNMATTMKRHNDTKGIHTWQGAYGCEMHHDGTTTAYSKFAYDGNDYVQLDLYTGTFTAHMNAFLLSWSKAWTLNCKQYLENDCFKELHNYVGFGRSSLERKVPPEVSLFQKDSSSPVVCHATGFYPKAVMISWQKNGEDLDEDMELRETLPNLDGTFQRRSILTVPPEDLYKHNYTCIIQHSSLEKEMVLQVMKRRVLQTHLIVGIPAAVSLLALGICGGALVWKKVVLVRKGGRVEGAVPVQ